MPGHIPGEKTNHDPLYAVIFPKDNPEELSNGFTPRLHLLKVDYPIMDESTLCDAGCFFLWLGGGKIWIDYTRCSILKQKLHANEKKTQISVDLF